MRFILTIFLIFHAASAGGWVSGEVVGCQFAHKNMTCVDTSAFPVLTHAGRRVIGVVVHPQMADPLIDALNCLGEHNALETLRTYNGAINQRMIAGTNKRSKHWDGKAIDFNAGMKQPEVVVKCFEKAGFKWGGRWSPPDRMHFEID